MDKRKVIYYSDELHDEFSTAQITPRVIDGSYKYERNPLLRFFWYRMIATPLALFYVKCVLHERAVGREKLKPFRGTGFYLYGNHTQDVGDPLIPNVFCLPKDVSFIVHPNNVSMPVLGRINPYLGAIPLPDTKEAYRSFSDCVDARVKKGNALVIYPEAHIWPFYTGIRPFTDASFGYPARTGAPVFCFVNTYRKRKRGRRPSIVTYIDGPFYPDMDLPLGQRRKKLHSEVYGTMCERAKNSDVEVIKYIKKSDTGAVTSE